MARKAEAEPSRRPRRSGLFREPPAWTRARFSTVTRWCRAPTHSCPKAAGGGGGSAPPTTRTSQSRCGSCREIRRALRLGVRVSILRGDTEADLNTALDPGETVRLKLIPNADGFLYVADGAQIMASGAAQRLKPFITPEVHLEGSGQKQLYVMLSRNPQTVAPQSIGSLCARRSGRDFAGPGTRHLRRDGLARGVRPAYCGAGYAYLAVTPHTASTNNRATSGASNRSTRARPFAACAARASGDS